MSFSKKSKILYLSDTYAENVRGTKVSILKEMKKRGFDITFANIHSAGRDAINGKELLKTLKQGGFTDLWISHTWVTYVGCTLAGINKLGVRVLGFGFSDPYAWNSSKLKQYNRYCTNSIHTLKKIKDIIPTMYFPTACDTSFHKNLGMSRPTDILVYGVGLHPRFKPGTYRLEVLSTIMKKFSNRTIKVYGRKWDSIKSNGILAGQEFLEEINKAKIGLDLQQLHAPLAHRMFELTSCGCVAITRDRKEVTDLLQNKKDIFVYADTKHLITIIGALLNNDQARCDYAKSMYKNTIKNHNISNRVDTLLRWLSNQELYK